ncbi:Retinol dehydrogenase 12 [Trichoplax sp. H2]|nr:Retinol dehydrogenase 12 [Trichoplax sp. H2]|eukprot:RDD41042.1 Retinol dehydrogenase 12 [Trichoplax sp. H2]
MGNKATKLSLPENISLNNVTAIVTGANRGIGYGITLALARMGATVILACRSQESAKEAIENLQLEHKSLWENNNEGKFKKSILLYNNEEFQELKLQFMPLDLSSLRSIYKFIEDVKSLDKPIQLLICNAGIGNASQGYTEDGYERHFQINYLGHCLIALELLPIMNKSGEDIRIVQVSSLAHSMGKLDFNNVQGNKSYSRIQMYSNSKLFQIMFMFSLQQKITGSNIGILSVHPGVVATEINRNFQDSFLWRNFDNVLKGIGMMKDCKDGASSAIIAAVSPAFKGCSGIYISDRKCVATSKLSRNTGQQQKLWDYTIGLLKEYLSEESLKFVEEN